MAVFEVDRCRNFVVRSAQHFGWGRGSWERYSWVFQMTNQSYGIQSYGMMRPQPWGHCFGSLAVPRRENWAQMVLDKWGLDRFEPARQGLAFPTLAFFSYWQKASLTAHWRQSP